MGSSLQRKLYRGLGAPRATFPAPYLPSQVQALCSSPALTFPPCIHPIREFPSRVSACLQLKLAPISSG